MPRDERKHAWRLTRRGIQKNCQSFGSYVFGRATSKNIKKKSRHAGADFSWREDRFEKKRDVVIICHGVGALCFPICHVSNFVDAFRMNDRSFEANVYITH